MVVVYDPYSLSQAPQKASLKQLHLEATGQKLEIVQVEGNLGSFWPSDSQLQAQGPLGYVRIPSNACVKHSACC
jgi:hypothetical protein